MSGRTRSDLMVDLVLIPLLLGAVASAVIFGLCLVFSWG